MDSSHYFCDSLTQQHPPHNISLANFSHRKAKCDVLALSSLRDEGARGTKLLINMIKRDINSIHLSATLAIGKRSATPFVFTWHADVPISHKYSESLGWI